jgi:glycosyltransferase involved in cell wall biosynthesis
LSSSLSVIVAAFDSEDTIGATLTSLTEQTHRPLEVIVVDDGSADATADVAEQHDGPVRVVRKVHTGVAATRNRGIAEARGALLTFCDADDVCLPEHLQTLVDAHERGGDLVTANGYWVFPQGVHRTKQRFKGSFPARERQRRAILEQNFLSIATLFPRSLVDRIGPFDETLRRAEDWDFWLRAIFAGYRVVLRREPLVLFRWGAAGLSSDWAAMDADVEAVLRRVEDRVELTEQELGYVRRRAAGPGPHALARRGDEALRDRRYRDAARAYRAASVLAPSERRLVWKARALLTAPRLLGPLVRARQLRIERALGFGPEHVR